MRAAAVIVAMVRLLSVALSDALKRSLSSRDVLVRTGRHYAVLETARDFFWMST
jgi:hypothetical protein